MTGSGAARHPGRWNDRGEAVVYAAPSIALAVLDTAVHIDDAGLPLNRFLVEIDVPEAVWAQHEELDVGALPPTWCAIPAGRSSVMAGSAWLASLRSPILLVPSEVVPEERAALLNPAHSACRRLRASTVRSFDYNRLFRP